MTPLRTAYLHDRDDLRPSEIRHSADCRDRRGRHDVKGCKLFSAQNLTDATKFRTLFVYGIGLGRLAINSEPPADIRVYSFLGCLNDAVLLLPTN
jgi:hypothetical protein